MLAMNYDPSKGFWIEEEEGVERLRKNYFGDYRKGKVFLNPEEALYLIAFQNATCYGGKGERVGFNQAASFMKEKGLFVKYNAYRDWRDRGLVIKRFRELRRAKGEKSMKKYPSRNPGFGKLNAGVTWYPDDLYAVLEDPSVGKELFEKHWIGQFGVYKQDRGNLLVLDFFEAIFLSKHASLRVESLEGKALGHRELLRQVEKRREYARQIYEVYEDWRLRGYVVKSGFKFGSHFRIYFPGASPAKEGKYVHSRHVLHVFPKEQKLLISEWARAVRVAHGVKKTFLLGIPELSGKDFINYPADFIAYRRKKRGSDWVRETPEDKPRYLLAAVAEDEMIGGLELASLLKKANSMGLELLLSITDRESAITYYVLKKIKLPESDQEYYEIEWMKP